MKKIKAYFLKLRVYWNPVANYKTFAIVLKSDKYTNVYELSFN